MKKIFLILLFISSLGSLSAQSFVHKINPYPSESRAEISQIDTLNILAIMVEFQEDRDNTTFGNGKFGSIYSGENLTSQEILDPLPHDKNYFEDHLLFAANYYKNVSNDNLNVNYQVLENIITVSQTMRNYSPAQNSDDLAPLGEFAKEVWQLVDQSNPAIDLNSFDLFFVFHAGVGRDVSLPGSVGNEKDLPSVYLGENSLKKIFGETFQGFPMSNGSFNITNTAIIPATESRELEGIGGSVLLELSINGLIAANVASFAGLPDLFDTETGLSAIGRFGLMDGQSIFAYGGTFPPEPSPWEKIQFGWIEPTVVNFTQDEITLNLMTRHAASISDTTILKIPINQNEYYLVENRARDAQANGAVVTYKVGNETRTLTIPEDVDNFESFDVDTLAGVVIDVDEFDWAVPGNGIVIWHIDEKIIAEKLPTNSINADIENRGVDIEEADGVQDIGVEFTTIFGDVVIGEGSEEDLWYASNPAKLFENIFDGDSRPNTNSNDGAASLISISNFSDAANRMSFNLKFGENNFGVVSSSKLPWTEKVEHLTSQKINGEIIFYFISNGRLDRLNFASTVTNSFDNFSDFLPAATQLTGSEYVFGTKGKILNIFRKTDTFELVSSYDLGETFSCPPVIRHNSNDNIDIILGTETGKVWEINLNAAQSSDPDTNNIRLVTDFPGESVKQLTVSEFGDVSVITEISHYGFQKTNYQFTGKLVKVVSSANLLGYVDVVSDDRNNLYVIQNNNVISNWTVPGESVSFTFSVSDLFEDGNNYILYPSSDKLYAYNLSGSRADNFPFLDKRSEEFIGTPLAADINSDNKTDVISSTADGRIIVISGKDASIVSPFPVSLGAKNITTPILFSSDGVSGISGDASTLIASVTEDNNFSIWKIGDLSVKPMWAGEFGNNFNSSYVSAPSSSSPVSTEFFPKERAYNYPNPVYDGKTFIRYFVLEDSKIEIKIFDLAGDLVAELFDTAIGNFDNETTWNVSDVESGVYFAHLEVTGESGKSDKKVIKVAVIK